MRWGRSIFAVIAFVCAILWLTSYFMFTRIGGSYSGPSSYMEIGMAWDRLGFGYGNRFDPSIVPQHWFVDFVSLKEDDWGLIRYQNTRVNPPMKGVPLFAVSTRNWGSTKFHHWNFWIQFPLWLPTLLFGLWPATALTRHVKRRYFTHGICRKCGYDLRGTLSGVCPECGNRAKSGGRETI